MLELKSCPKGYTLAQDKAVAPERTAQLCRKVLGPEGRGVLEAVERIDTGRLGIPVYVSRTSEAARRVMPTKKQMGKGSSPEQAEASALMELAERYSFFSYFADDSNFTPATWSEAEALWPDALMPLSEIIKSVSDDLSEADARRIMDLSRRRFAPVLNVASGRTEYAPLDWFKALNEFNGSSAGNTPEESIMQGACELIERHVSALAARDEPELPTVVPGPGHPVLARLVEAFEAAGVRVVLKDMSMGLPAPTVGALAWDPATFPAKSEIVFTAGAASSPAKAAIRALTEVAQLGGDFETGSNYEASGLPKYRDLAQAAWLLRGPETGLSTLPSVEAPDFLDELAALARGLAAQGFTLYSADLTRPQLGVPANYNFVPGFAFRERARNQSLGLFAGRDLAERAEPLEALAGLEVIEQIYPDAHFTPFFRGLARLRAGEAETAAELFAEAENLAPYPEDRALAAFYRAYALSTLDRWAEAEPFLDKALDLDPEAKEYLNLRGVARFKAGEYELAAADFRAALDLDSGSATDLANLGMCHKRLGRTVEAVHCLGQALQLDPALDFARRELDEILDR
jgi:ribosomal protein S12 methylthiotransferase accessory factor